MALDISTQGLARSSSRRPWLVIGLWIVALAVAFFLSSTLLDDGLTSEFEFTNTPESKQGYNLLEERLTGPRGANEVVVIQSETLTVDDPVYRQFVEELYIDLADLGPEVIREGTLINYYLTGAESLVSGDRHSTIMPLTMAGDVDQASDNIHLLSEVVQETRNQSQFRALMVGQATVGKDFQEVSQEDLEKGEAFGVPIALLILVLVLGALVAALLPVAVAGVSILIALGAASVVGQTFQLSFFVTNMITMIGLAVGIDYSLFIIARYREERARGLDKLDAIARTGNTATRAVFFSGMTVVLALVGMLLVPSNVFIALGTGAILVVVISVLASLTLLPAVISLLGDRINALAIPIIGRLQQSFDDQRPHGFWDRLSRTVMRFPILSLILGGGLLVALAVPFFDINTGAAGVSSFPDTIESKEGFLILEQKFSAGEVTPAEIVVDGDAQSAPVQQAIEQLTALISADPAFSTPRPLRVNPAGNLALLSVPVEGDSVSEETQDAIRRLRHQYIPQAFQGVTASVYVTGETAFNMDFFSIASDAVPVVFPFVLGISFILLMLVFRSIVVPVKAIIMNLLSVGATYGLLVLIFQKGVGNEFFGFQQVDTIEAWIPLFLFSVLFGLSMDYHVFLLSRIREHYDQTRDNTGSVAFGIRSTGRLITGAALIMVAVFWGFASGSLVPLQQMGFGMGMAILLDATIVRSILVPASMRLLGNFNWYLPAALRWLPDLRVDEGDPAGLHPAPAASGSSDD